MTKMKKLIAALTAITSMVSLGVGTISASAADLDAINEKILNDTASDEEKFIAEYANDSEEMKVAEYVINSGISESDAELNSLAELIRQLDYSVTPTIYTVF